MTIAKYDYAVVLKCDIFQVAEGASPKHVGALYSDCEDVGMPLAHDEMIRRGTLGLQAAAGIIGIGMHPVDRVVQWLRSNHPELSSIADAIARGEYRS